MGLGPGPGSLFRLTGRPSPTRFPYRTGPGPDRAWPYPFNIRAGLARIATTSLKDLGLLNDSLLKKFTWKFVTSKGFAFSFLRERYLKHLRKPYGGLIGLQFLLFGLILGMIGFRVRLLTLRAVDFRFVLSLVWHTVFGANRFGIGCMLNCVDDLWILRCFGLLGCPTKTLVIKSVIWSPLAPGWIKVNTDGAAFVKGCFAIHLGQAFAFEAEFLAASMGINLSWKYRWRQIWPESESSYVVQLLSSHSKHVPWRV
ncbi:hypothetical protein Dsin_010799 [Dipteronia sinensis]|uniref:RNase H type-1 domain-containing protein n=1 Tax=Dipteronia sinensis TaxID=43782 RepID=A0AAE0AUD6_9ROSI|nr:hypothetical protein Dsin_010799 [Dipteronia sinensis]